MKTTSKTFMNIAADYGLVLGALFCVTFFAGMYTLRLQALSLVMLACVVAVPVVVWTMMRRTVKSSRHTTPFATLWSQGIAAFAFGSLLLALAVYIFFKWIEPDMLLNAVEILAQQWEAQGTHESIANANALRVMVDSGQLPHPSEIAFQLICLTIFTGSLLSMAEAGLMRLVRNYRKKH